MTGLTGQGTPLWATMLAFLTRQQGVLSEGAGPEAEPLPLPPPACALEAPAEWADTEDAHWDAIY